MYLFYVYRKNQCLIFQRKISYNIYLIFQVALVKHFKITLVTKIARDHNFKALVLKLNISTLKIITALDNYA